MLNKKKEMAYRTLLMDSMTEVENLQNQLKALQGRMNNMAKQESSMQLAVTKESAKMSRALQKAKRQGAAEMLNQAGNPEVVVSSQTQRHREPRVAGTEEETAGEHTAYRKAATETLL